MSFIISENKTYIPRQQLALPGLLYTAAGHGTEVLAEGSIRFGHQLDALLVLDTPAMETNI